MGKNDLKKDKGENISSFFRKLRNAYTIISIQLLTVLILLTLLEMGFRVFGDYIQPVDIHSQTLITGEGQEPYFQYHPFAAFSWIPNARFLKQSVNSDGFVSTRNIPFEKEKNELRIITLGGSSTVGNGNVDTQTYPRILEKILQERFPNRKINVINAAAGGYSTRESLGYLQSRLIFYNPDIVIVMHGWNDMYYFTKTDEELSQWRKDFNLQAMWNPEISRKLNDLMPTDLQYLSWSQLYLHLRDYLRKSDFFNREGANTIEKRFEGLEVDKDGKYVFTAKPINMNGFMTYKNNLQQILTICRENDINVYSILQPTLFSKETQVANNKLRTAIKTLMAFHAFGYQEHVDAFQRMYWINKEVFGEENVIDATPMNGREELFFDHIHQSPNGTHTLAKLVYEKIKKDINE